MHREFWIERWATQRIGFHLDHPNPTLVKAWSALQLNTKDTVLVPLCGKSHDLSWLAEHGHSVIGIELSSHAIESFFAESQMKPSYSAHGPFRISQTANISLWCGSFFELEKQDLPHIGGFYDRASVIALPAELRQRYARTLSKTLSSGTVGLMITIEYPSDEMEGPPFSVPPAEVERLLGDTFVIDHLSEADIFSPESRLAERGVTALTQHVFKLTRK